MKFYLVKDTNNRIIGYVQATNIETAKRKIIKKFKITINTLNKYRKLERIYKLA